jgi:multicomponent K+:H+ antiporter subunit E
MKRWLPSPLLSAALFVMWLLLNQSLGAGHLLLGAAVGVVMPWLMAPLRPAGGAVKKPWVVARLIVRVGGDVVRSAIDVARGVMRPANRPVNSGFVVVPLDLRDAHALAALAIITAVVPGTVWAELAPDCSSLLLHVFDLKDPTLFIAHFKTRYELPLKEIFE